MAKKKNTRASNGMGSIRKRPDGRWEGRYTAPDGRQRSIYGKTERDVTARLRGALHDIDAGSWHEPSKMTVGEWLDIWLKDYQGHTSGRTVLTYKSVIGKHIKPVLGSIKLAKISPIHVRRMMSNMTDLSPSSIRHACSIFGASMRCAIEAGLIKTNPCTGVKLPRRVKSQFTVIDREQIQAFIEAAKNTKYPNELILMLLTGLRVGEIRGLQWDDIDMEKNTLHVQRQLHSATQMKSIAPPKDGEDRVIQLPQDAVDVLKRQRKRQLEQRIAAGSNWYEDDLSRCMVFLRPSGKLHTSTTIYDAAREAGHAIGLDLSPHDLRHSYAVAALRSGIDVKTVQHNLGHKNASITLDTYAAYTTDAGKSGAKKLSEYLKNADI